MAVPVTDSTRDPVRRQLALTLAAKRRTALAAVVAERAFGDAVRCALAGGIPAAEVAKLANLSRARVYQIRDGRR